MKKFLLVFFALSGVVFSSRAQYHDASPKISAGYSRGATVGPGINYYPTVRATSLKLAVPISASPFSLTLTTGYTQFISKSGYVAEVNSDGSATASRYYANFVPVEIGVKDYVYNRLFFEGNIGASFNVNSNHSKYTDAEVATIFATNIGYSIPLGKRDNYAVDLSVGYENRIQYAGGYSQIAFKAAFSFGL
jgi:hypothetical protein